MPYRYLLMGLTLGIVALFFGRNRKGSRRQSQAFFITVFLAIASLLMFLLMAFVVQSYRVPSAGMENAIQVGDHLVVNKFLYGVRFPFSNRRILALRAPQRGDVVVFQFPVDDPMVLHCGSVQRGKVFLKRLIGEPGDRIEVRQGRVILNDKPLGDELPYALHDASYIEPVSPRAGQITPAQYQKLWEQHLLDEELNNNQRDFFGPVKVPEHAYFVMGDNRDHSCDSRYWGPVEESYIEGKAWYILKPPERVGVVH